LNACETDSPKAGNETGFCIEYREVSNMEWTILGSVPGDQNSYGPVRFYGNSTFLIRIFAFH
jgi:hypothetical protein